MGSSDRFTDRYPEQIKLRLRKRSYLTEPQERELLREAVDAGIPLERAKEVLAGTLAQRRARRETAFRREIALIIETFVGDKGWLSRSNFNRAATLHCRLSGGAISPAEASIRVKQLMLDRGWGVRGETIFGPPAWFRAIPERLDHDRPAAKRR
jgi:hypothetical protein